MNASIFTPAHQALRSELREFLAAHVEPHAQAWEQQASTPPEVFRLFGRHGYLALSYPKELGGGGHDFLTGLVLAEELYRSTWGGLAISILGHCGVAIHPLAAAGTDEQRAKYLKPALQGTKISAIAVTEPEAGSDVSSLRTRAELTPAGWRIDGRKMFVSLGCCADFYLIAARTSEGRGSKGISLLLVESGTPGLKVIRKLEKLGMRGSDTAEIELHDCVVPRSALIGEEGKGFYAIMRQFQAERLILAAGALSMARRALDIAIDYSRKRVQFGHPIAHFQALRHRFADAVSELEAQRAFVYVTARRYQDGEYPAAEIAMCKLLAARTAFWIVDDMLQVLGGYGYITDYPMERIWRDVRLMRIGGGTDEIQREIIARSIGLDGPATSAEPAES
jgi:alkylation response protein AidB-like acyl-CoA dehydrogenase